MEFRRTDLEGVLIIEPTVHLDSRGFFLESYHFPKYREGGIKATFIQDNHSRSAHGVLRGLHAQLRPAQAKLVRVTLGEVFDVVVDIRPGSQSFGQWVGTRLSAENFRQIYVPAGFAHGFVTLSETAELQYKCDAIYEPSGEIAIRWDDPEIGVEWPVEAPSLSERDARAPLLSEIADTLSKEY